MVYKTNAAVTVDNILLKLQRTFSNLKFIFIFASLNSSFAYGLETIKIDKGHRDPIPIAIQTPKIVYIEGEKIAKDMFDIVKSDLEHSGAFRILPPESFVDKITGVDYMPNFQAWQIINTHFLLNSEIQIQNRSEILIKLVLYDVISQRVFAQDIYKASISNLRKLSHLVSNFIYEKTTGEQGYFNSKIAYVAANYKNGKKITRIATMDYDGYNHKFITDGRSLVLTPRFSKDGSHLAYVSYAQKVPRVIIKNIYSGKEIAATEPRLMSTAPRFSNDGKKMLITISKGGKSNIFELDLFSHQKSQITNNQYINTSGTYSYDGNNIFFCSDMARKINIYKSDRRGFGSVPIGLGAGNYFTPVQSPNGDYMAATKMENGNFSIVVLKPDGTKERKITEGFLVESPCFSPNSNMVAFTREERNRVDMGKNKQKLISASYIYAVDVTGRYMRKINTPGFAFDPDWSNDLTRQPDFWSHQ